MMDFSEKICLITGASGNLGNSIARKFIAHGANIALLDLNHSILEEMYSEFLPERYFVQQANVIDPVSVERAITAVLNYFERIDILVNTVGGYRADTPLHKTPIEIFNFMLDLNARSVYNTCKTVIPFMIEQNFGKIISIAARPGLKGSANAAAYSVSKSAVIRLTESMSAELIHNGINVNCIIPGTIDTLQNRKDMPNADFSKWVATDSIADVTLFLASEMATAIHGAAIPVYGRS